jgi:hypothetical protein
MSLVDYSVKSAIRASNTDMLSRQERMRNAICRYRDKVSNLKRQLKARDDRIARLELVKVERDMRKSYGRTGLKVTRRGKVVLRKPAGA